MQRQEANSLDIRDAVSSDTWSAGKPPGAHELGHQECRWGWALALDNILRANAALQPLPAKTNERGEFNSGTGRPLRQCEHKWATLALPLLVLLSSFHSPYVRPGVNKLRGVWRLRQVANTPRFLPLFISPFSQLLARLLVGSFKHVMHLCTFGHVKFREGCFGVFFFLSVFFIYHNRKDEPTPRPEQMIEVPWLKSMGDFHIVIHL